MNKLCVTITAIAVSPHSRSMRARKGSIIKPAVFVRKLGFPTMRQDKPESQLGWLYRLGFAFVLASPGLERRSKLG